MCAEVGRWGATARRQPRPRRYAELPPDSLASTIEDQVGARIPLLYRLRNSMAARAGRTTGRLWIVDDRPADPRARAALTKRIRTRAALIAAADSAFSRRGWAATRIEDIADAAGVSPATAYNHFPTKHALLGTVYEPHVRGLIRQAERDIAAGRPVVEALVDQVNALARLSWYHRGLTASFTAAVFDYTIRTGSGPDPDDEADPRILAPLNLPFLLLIERGQATGELRPHPAAAEISGMVVNLLLVRSINRGEEPPAVTADLMLTLLFGALRPELVVARDGAGSRWT